MSAGKLRQDGFEPFEAPRSETFDSELPTAELMAEMRSNMLRLYGPPFFSELNLMGNFLGQRSLLTNDPEVIRKVFVDHVADFRRTDPTMRILKPIFGNGLLLSDGEEWRFQRRTMAPAFAPRALDIVARMSVEAAQNAVDGLHDAAATGETRPLLRLTEQIALDVAGRAMFSMPMDERGPRLRSHFENYGINVGRPFPLDMLLPRQVPSPADLRRRRLGSRWLNFIQALLEERARMKRSDDARDLFDLLVNARDPESGAAFTRRQLRDQFATMIIAGHETSSITLMWALIMTARSKALRDMIAAEAETLMDGEAVTAKKVERMRVTRATVMETLRLFPPVFLIVREAKRPIRLAGRILFKGDVVSIAPWTLHRHEQHWQAPTLFNPERFLDDAKTPARYTYMPFGAGPRICIGMSFSLTEITAVLGLLLRDFRFEIVSEEPIVPRAVLATYPDPLPRYRVQEQAVTKKAA